MPASLNIYRLSESAVTIQFGDSICSEMLNIITAYNSLLHSHSFPGFITATPAYTTLTVFFDFFIVNKSSLLKGNTCFEKVSNYLNSLYGKLSDTLVPVLPDIIEIPVCYENEFAPDLEDVSMRTDLSANQIVQLHTAPIYLVHMIGFIPGFAYMGGLDERLATPRKNKVTPLVAAGAVGIAAKQTGIYPINTPGGWQIIGRTPVTMFDISKQHPSYLKPGDRVRFKSISMVEFEQYNRQ